MNTKVVVAVVVILALLGGGAALMLKKPTSTPQPVPQSIPTETPSVSKSLRDLFTAGISQTCTFSDASSNTSTTVYVSGSKMRGDFSGGHMITMDNTTYYWMDGQTTGYKMSMAAPTGPAPTGSQASASSQVDLDKQTDYKCSVWVADETKFDLPTNIKFTNPSAVMTGAPKIDCSACDSAPAGAARDQCLVALKCN